MTTNDLNITLFGEFSMSLEGQTAVKFQGDRPLSLLAYLLLHRHTAVSRSHLAYTLWPDSSDSQARTNLRNLLYTLRQTLPQADAFLAVDGMTIQWCPDAHYELDVAAFEAALAAAQAAVAPADKIAQLETAVSLYRGDLLPGNYDDWIIPLREEQRQNYLNALYQLVTLLEQAQDYRQAARYSQRLLQQDPLDETAYVQLMRLHARSGDRAGVRRVYETCVTTLRRELDVEPSPATQAAYEQLLRQEIPVTIESSPTPETGPPAEVMTPVSRPRALPQPGTAFIGREVELAHIAEMLADPGCRLITIIGPGGMGKTRLALQTAVGHQRIFTDGVVWVSLNTAQNTGQIATAIAGALQCHMSSTAQTTTELINLLADKQVLLVLDNFEHLLESATFLSDLLNQTTAVKLLVTSRQALELQQEWRYYLAELPLPDAADPESLVTNCAIQLFEQSARRAQNTFTLTPADFTAVARICRLIDGMPLGIELAASWVRLLSCAEIVQEIEKNLDFLTVSLRDLPQRHRSLRAVFAYSWDLLSAAEQQVLAQLTVFHGGFTREAAAAVAAADLTLLSSLTNHSLVQRSAAGRYHLHNIVRQYATEHLLETATSESASRRHSNYYLQWLAQKEAALCSAGQKEALAEIALELANVQAAWQTAVETRQTRLLQEASFPLFYFYELRGLMMEGETQFGQTADSLLAAPTAAEREMQIIIGNCRTNQGYFATRLGRVTIAETTLRQVIAQLEALPTDSGLSFSLRYLGLVLANKNSLAEAAACFQRSLALAQQQQRPWETAVSQAYLSLSAFQRGQLTTAQQFIETALANSRQLGDPRLISFSLLIFARANLFSGHLVEAENQLAESMSLARQTNDPYTLTTARLYLGLVKQTQGDLVLARQLLQESIDAYTYAHDLVGAARAQVSLGFLELEAGNPSVAKKLFQQFLQFDQHEFGWKHILSALIGLAILRAEAGDPETAFSWVLTILNHPDLDWESKHHAQSIQADLISCLTPEQLAAVQVRAANQEITAVLAEAAESNGVVPANNLEIPKSFGRLDFFQPGPGGQQPALP